MIFIALGCAPVLAFGASWLVSPEVFGISWRTAVVIAATGVLTTIAGIGLSSVWTSRQLEAVKRYIDHLTQLDPRELGIEADAEQVNYLDVDASLRTILGRFRERVASLSATLEEADQARARSEVRTRRAAAESEQVTQILDGLADPVLAIDQYEEITWTNDKAEELFELEDCVETRVLRDLVQCQDLVNLLSETRRRKKPVQRVSDIEYTDSTGQTHWYRAQCRNVIEDSKGGAVAVLSDISDRKAIQKRHAEFVSSVSHEMKTPLSGIKAYVELLADGDAEDVETREEFLSVINGQADRLQRLIDNLLNLARIEAGVVSVTKEPQSLNELLEEAVRVVQPSADAKQITLHVALSPMYIGVLADRDLLLQAAINLLSNAIKYTNEKGSITYRSQMQGDSASFEVEDSGVGLSKEDCARVFDKFYRVQKDRNMAAGTGLGLPLAKHIVEDVHSGQLMVHSELGKGSTFSVVLPRVLHQS